ncbi:hypothetical protein J1614_008752 [Plenodomus biglobosus]|nr:hypothetical protein J1614_008752 [Plenodomus biglobosus]
MANVGIVACDEQLLQACQSLGGCDDVGLAAAGPGEIARKGENASRALEWDGKYSDWIGFGHSAYHFAHGLLTQYTQYTSTPPLSQGRHPKPHGYSTAGADSPRFAHNVR